MSNELVAQLNMKEFDPTKERHHPLLIVKLVDPGCTVELQIENCKTGEVTRVTSTESEDDDVLAMEAAILQAFRKAWEGEVVG